MQFLIDRSRFQWKAYTEFPVELTQDPGCTSDNTHDSELLKMVSN